MYVCYVYKSCLKKSDILEKQIRLLFFQHFSREFVHQFLKIFSDSNIFQFLSLVVNPRDNYNVYYVSASIHILSYIFSLCNIASDDR